jgi:hypothetical protein
MRGENVFQMMVAIYVSSLQTHDTQVYLLPNDLQIFHVQTHGIAFHQNSHLSPFFLKEKALFAFSLKASQVA